MELFVCTNVMQVLSALLICESERRINSNLLAKFVLFDLQGRNLKDLKQKLEALSFVDAVDYYSKSELSGINFHLWVKNEKLRRRYSFFDSVLYTIKLRRKRFADVVTDLILNGMEKSIRRVFWFTSSFVIFNLVDKVRMNGAKSILLDEGVASYLSLVGDKREGRYEERYLLEPRLYSGEPCAIKKIDTKMLGEPWFNEILGNIFATTKRYKFEQVLWIAQHYQRDFGCLKGVDNAHKLVFDLFCKKMIQSGIRFEFREHPSGSDSVKRMAERIPICFIAPKSSIPFELESFFGLRDVPKSIYTISSTAGVFCHILFPDLFRKTKCYFYVNVFAKNLGVSIEELHPGIDGFLKRARSLWPDNIEIL